MIPQNTPVKVTVNTLPSLKEGGKQNGEWTYNSILTERPEDLHLPKIVEVYSLNSRTSNVQEPGLKSNTQGGLLCEDKTTFIRKSDMSAKEPSKSLLRDANTCTYNSQMKPYLVSGNFIDLTIDEEEETTSCNDDNMARPGDDGLCGRNVNAGNQSEFDQPREDTGDKRRQRKQSNQSKRKGVFGNIRKCKIRCPAKNQKQDANKYLNTGDQNKTQCRALNDQQEYSYHGNGEQRLNELNSNNNWRKEERKNSAEKEHERKEHWNGSGINVGVHISSGMTCRESKITTLKARLVKQEEELARLITQKKSKIAQIRGVEAPYQDAAQEKTESEANDLSNNFHEKHEAEKDDPVEVNLDDICQHVIKSFDIFNARQWEGKKEGLHTLYEEDTCIIKQANGRKSDLNDVAHLPQGRQEEFLFQIGLRRRRPSNS